MGSDLYDRGGESSSSFDLLLKASSNRERGDYTLSSSLQVSWTLLGGDSLHGSSGKVDLRAHSDEHCHFYLLRS